MDSRICSIRNASRWLLSSVILVLFMGCSGGSSTQNEISGELTVDESLSPEQQLELYQLQTNAFADSIFREGYSILVRDVDSLFYVYYAKRDTLYQAHYDDFVVRPPIMFKDIKTGRIQEVSIPTTIDGRQIRVNTIIDYRGFEGQVIMSVTGKSPKDLEDKIYESFDILYFVVKDNSFHYILGGRPWDVGKESVYDFSQDWIRIPFSEIIDGTYKDNPALSPMNQVSTDDDGQLDSSDDERSEY